jgi:Insertion element 4 transposase N-terminal/Transposase DDE domain
LSTQSATTTISHEVTVAVGVFAPGHLGELTQYLPFEVVDDVLAQTGTVQRRLRSLPSRAGVYFLLALGMFPQLGYARVWGKLTAGLAGLDLPRPPEKALRDLRRRLGPAPLKALFKIVAGPLAQPCTPGVRFGGLRTVAFDGLNSLKIPGTSRNRSWAGKIRHRMGLAGYPALRLMTLAETGIRGLPGAALGSRADRDETGLARRLLHLPGPGMLVLADRAFDRNAFLADIAATGAVPLVRAGSARTPLVLAHLPDGSYLSRLEGLDVRIVEAEIAMTGADGTRIADSYRLITTLTDLDAYPAEALARLYHERWEIESPPTWPCGIPCWTGGCCARATGPASSRNCSPADRCQLLRMAMVDAIKTRPGTDPDRAGFTTALEAARDQLTAAAGICPAGPPGLTFIGRAVLDTLLPSRRPRFSTRKVKCATSRYLNHGDERPHAVTVIAGISVTVCTPPLRTTASVRRPDPRRLFGPRPRDRRRPRPARQAADDRVLHRKQGQARQGYGHGAGTTRAAGVMKIATTAAARP